MQSPSAKTFFLLVVVTSCSMTAFIKLWKEEKVFGFTKELKNYFTVMDTTDITLKTDITSKTNITPKKTAITPKKTAITPKMAITSNVREKQLRRPSKVKKHVKTHRIADACIIGAQKTGTASLQRFLRRHPYIMTRTNETWFFDRDYNYNKGPQHYANMLPAAYDYQILLDTTPRYFITEEVPSRIKKVNPNMKLILSVRDPVTRLVSGYIHNRVFGDPTRPEVKHSFEEMVFHKNGSINTTYQQLVTSIYIKHFRNWMKYFGMDQLCIVDGDKFVKGPVVELKRIEKFLNIPPKIKQEDLIFDKEKGFYCLKKKTNVNCMADSKGRKHPDISKETLRKLYDFYRPYNKEFMEYTNLSVAWNMKS